MSPRRLQELHPDLTKATARLEQIHGRPTVPELADDLNLDGEQIIEGLVAGNGYTSSSLDSSQRCRGLRRHPR
ncbi:sigma-70 domain-containing protein [Streptomyces coeruleorubidus]|uniref:sigma-70 domain-containing protein n=1 Tax=Streptomyces coeruleorubidus TaxID=116188 RepID=UPI0033FE1E05